MNKTTAVLFLALVFAGGFILFYQKRPIKQETSVVTPVDQPANTNQHWAPKMDERSEVAVTVTPIDLSPEAKEWKFNIVMNTHSVELENPMKSTVLVDNQGKEYKPTGWNGPTEGHHMNGILTFNPIVPVPKSFEIKISGVGDVVKSFVWQLN